MLLRGKLIQTQEFLPVGYRLQVIKLSELIFNFMCNIADIDECESNPCRDNGVCTDGINYYVCNCTTGYNGPNCNLGISAYSEHRVRPIVDKDKILSRSISIHILSGLAWDAMSHLVKQNPRNALEMIDLLAALSVCEFLKSLNRFHITRLHHKCKKTCFMFSIKV